MKVSTSRARQMQRRLTKVSLLRSLQRNGNDTRQQRQSLDRSLRRQGMLLLSQDKKPILIFCMLQKLYTAPLPCGIAAETLLSSINANAHVISASPMLCIAEEACVSSLTALCGWDVVSLAEYKDEAVLICTIP